MTRTEIICALVAMLLVLVIAAATPFSPRADDRADDDTVDDDTIDDDALDDDTLDDDTLDDDTLDDDTADDDTADDDTLSERPYTHTLQLSDGGCGC